MTTGDTNPDEFKHSKRYLNILLIVLVLFFAFNYFYYFGVISLPKNDLLNIVNYNDKTTYKAWDSLTSQRSWLIPGDSLRYSAFQLSVSTPDITYWPKNVLPVQVNINPSGPGQVSIPSILVLILDSNGFIRGKAYVQFSSDDNILKDSSKSQLFIFNLPGDMQGQRITVMGELWGASSYFSNDQNTRLPRGYQDTDQVYGELPPNPSFLDYKGFQLVGYDRQEFSTCLPWPASILQFGPVLSVTGFLSAIFGLFIWFRTKVIEYIEKILPEYRALVLFLILALFFLALFMVLIALRV